MYGRTVAIGAGREPSHVFDTYFYHHTGTGVLRCLALSEQGGVYEGDVAVLEGGSVRLDLKGYEGNRVVSRVVQLDFEKDGSVRSRVSAGEGAERVLVLDVQYQKR
jgi:hypothetical protein